MNIRPRWIIVAVFFGFIASMSSVELATHIVAGSLALLFLAVGIWDSRRPSRYVLGDTPQPEDSGGGE